MSYKRVLNITSIHELNKTKQAMLLYSKYKYESLDNKM